MFLFVYFPSHYQLDTTLTPDDPGWVGAWWLGYIVTGIALFVTAIPLFLAARQVIPHRTSHKNTASTAEHGKDEKTGCLKRFGKKALVKY